MIEKINQYIKTLEKEAIPQLSINCAIFGFHDKSLKVIVNKIDLQGATMFLLPGGYVRQTENLTDAVERIVRQSTGLEKMLFRQFAVFGDASRSFEKEFETVGKSMTTSEKAAFKWFAKRFVSICYLALVDFNKIDLKPTQFLEAAQWLPVNKTKVLAMDHGDIVRSARESLIRELPYSPIASNLLPSKFTIPELHSLVEAVLGRSLDRGNFRRKILKSNLLVKIGQDGTGKRRPADVYTFKYGKKTSLNEEFRFGF
jgi:8-oxo-dGTP diphosphatase